MKIIISGTGHIGCFIAKYLANEDHDVTIIDTNFEIIKALTDTESLAGLVGDTTSIKNLKDADIENTDMFIATTDDDETNLIACMIANHFEVENNIIRIDKFHYLTNAWKELMRSDKFNITGEISNSETTIGFIQRTINHSYLDLSDVVEFVDGEIKMFSILCTKNTNILGKTIEQLKEMISNSNISYGCKILGITKKSSLKYDKNAVIEENNKIFFIALNNDLKQLHSLLYKEKSYETEFLENRNPNIVIAGDNFFIANIAIALSKESFKTKVISSSTDKQFNEKLSEELGQHNIKLILDDISNNTHRDQYIKPNNSLAILMYDNDEENIFKALSLKQDGFDNIICKLNDKSNYEYFLIRNGIANIYSPLDFVMPNILKQIRRGMILNAFSLYSSLEILELENSDIINLTGKRVLDIEKNGKIEIIAIFDDNNNLIDKKEDTIIHVNYKIIITIDRKNIKEFEDILLNN